MINKRIAIVQLTRIGDVIQTCIAAKQVLIENPDIELTLITRSKFAKGLEFLTKKYFKNVIYLNLKDYYNSKTTNLTEIVDSLDESFLEVVNSNHFDAAINLSFSKSSSYLMHLIKTENKLGLSRNEKGQVVINDQWSQFVYSNVQNGTLNVYNLVDIFKFIMGANEVSFSSHEADPQKTITIHPFASQRKKMWGSSKWSELIYKLLKENEDYKINILGADSDQNEVDKIINSGALISFKDRVTATVGASLESVYQTINTSSLLICHDSMASHLASVNTIPTIVLSLGVVRPNETTPYSNNVLNLVPKRSCFPCQVQTKCDLLPCHKDINHQLVSTLAGAILNGDELNAQFFTEKVSPFFMENVDIYIPTFENSFMTLFKLNESSIDTNKMMETYYRIIWSYFFRETEVDANIPQLSNEIKKDIYHHREGVNYLFELISFGLKFSNAIVNEAAAIQIDYNQINSLVGKLGEIDNLLTITKNTYPLLQPIVDYFYVAKANVAGRNIKEISENSLLLYYSLNNMCKVLYDLMTSTLKDEGAPLES